MTSDQESDFSQIRSRQLLQRFLNNQNANLDILYDLMPWRVREILLVATLYDTFCIEKEGRFTQHILGPEFRHSLINMPRITGVTSPEEALEKLENRKYDLIIIVGGSDKDLPFETAGRIKHIYPEQSIFLLINTADELSWFNEKNSQLKCIDLIFVFENNAKVFFAMVKNLEDKMNVDNDTKVGLIKVILLVEDSAQYYSKYLPLLYSTVMEQTRKIVESGDDPLINKLRQRLRPKILMAQSYEQAIDIADRYRENLMAVITDVEFSKDGVLNHHAGIDLIQHLRKDIPDLPVVIQSSDMAYHKIAYDLQSIFIAKQSETLLSEIRSFLSHQLGFGSYVFRDGTGQKIAQAKTLEEFIKQFNTIPDDSLIYHAKRNHYSLWLMSRGEIRAAKIIFPIKTTDFKTLQEYRNRIKLIIHRYRNESNVGKIIDFSEDALHEESNIVTLGTGELGGKGRGIAFVNTLIYNLSFQDLIPGIHVRNPSTSIIGTDEYDIFIEKNNLLEHLMYESDYPKIRDLFLKGELSYSLLKKLKSFVKSVSNPIAVRSSSLLEDSLINSFSGTFDTFFLPNNHPDSNVRLKQLSDAIKLVYASLFKKEALQCLKLANRKPEDEKMAIVLQDLVGKTHGNYVYPDVSGTAQSYNYYPIAKTRPEDGCVSLAVGLGKYIVEGGKSYRFSPKHPLLDAVTPKYLFKNSQVKFLAIDLEKSLVDMVAEGEYAGLTELDLAEAEKHGILKHCASVYNSDNETLQPGINHSGPRVIDFADILKYEYIPLSRTISSLLEIIQDALGSPVEIEFAVDLNRDENGFASLYLLQIKQLPKSKNVLNIDKTSIDMENILLYSETAMGNGRIDNIYDVVFIKPDAFDKTQTLTIAGELEKINHLLTEENRPYVLMGPGRWGTRDRFIGIPVSWPQISGARIIVEMSLRDFPLDASLGSHFFHNVTSMGVGYFSIQYQGTRDMIRWDAIKSATLISQTKYIQHVRYEYPLEILMDGKNQCALINLNRPR
ncbi:MAG: PEP/pyruvate-binding domain-containing protein [Bacteroidales bacterium]|nr:PEP/pyruvate-binding domain-containing protein [Bacteroidales bacterium]